MMRDDTDEWVAKVEKALTDLPPTELDTLRAEVERWSSAYEIAHNQAMENGSNLSQARAENAAKDATIARLAEALEPFVAIEHATVERAETLGYKDGNAAIPVPRKFLRDAALASSKERTEHG